MEGFVVCYADDEELEEDEEEVIDNDEREEEKKRGHLNTISTLNHVTVK